MRGFLIASESGEAFVNAAQFQYTLIIFQDASGERSQHGYADDFYESADYFEQALGERQLIVTSFDQWKQWAHRYTMLPFLCKYKLPEQERIPSWERAWERASEHAFVLESGKMGKYTYLGLNPVSTIRGKGNAAWVWSQERGETTEQQGAPLKLVKQWMQAYNSPKVEGAPSFIGGSVGYWGYDIIRSIETIPVTSADDLPFAEYYFMRINELWIVDHEHKQLYCAVQTPLSGGHSLSGKDLKSLYDQARQHASVMKAEWDDMASAEALPSYSRRIRMYKQAVKKDKLQIDIEELSGMETLFQKEEYMNAVRKIQEYIRQGDVFQVNLSVRQSRRLHSRPEEIYEWLRMVNPSPYMSFLRFPNFQIVSASPELLVKLEGTQVKTRPIAGTRPRGKDEAEDRQLAEELIYNEKERAEHIMLVDLQRNDLGRISRYGTVKVEDFMVIEAYSHVMHIVSEVRGQLAAGKDAYDVIAATFPGGTITGAPKIRTMEIIEELEPARRGPYTGSIGWIDYNGNMEFNIIIRTLLVSDGWGHVQAGAGIVIDSDPEREYIESLNKAKALWKAIQFSEQMQRTRRRNDDYSH